MITIHLIGIIALALVLSDLTSPVGKNQFSHGFNFIASLLVSKTVLEPWLI